MRLLPPLNTLLLATFPYLLPTVTAMPPWSTSPLPLLPLQALRQKLTSQPQPLIEEDLPTPPADMLLPAHVSVAVVVLDDAFPPPPETPGAESQAGDAFLAGDGDEEAGSIQLLAPVKFLPPPTPPPWSSENPDLEGGESVADMATSENHIASDDADSDYDASLSLIAPVFDDDDDDDNADNDNEEDDPALSPPNHSLYPDPDSDRTTDANIASHPNSPIHKLPSVLHFPGSIPNPNASPPPPSDINPHHHSSSYATAVTHTFHTLIPTTALQCTVLALACWITLCIIVGRWAGRTLRRRSMRARLLRRRGERNVGGSAGGRGAGAGGRGYGGYGGLDVDVKGDGGGWQGEARDGEGGVLGGHGVWIRDGGGGGGGVGGFEHVGVVGGVGLEVGKRKSLGSLKKVWFADEERGEEARLETVWLDDDHDGENGKGGGREFGSHNGTAG